VEQLLPPALLGLFAATASIVVVAGVVLARNADEIADRTGLGAVFVGMLLLAGATSLPELATDISAALAGAPNLAVGDLFGSSMANMAILAVILLLYRGHTWAHVGVTQARVAAVAIALTAGALLGIARPTGIALGWIGIVPVLLVVGYLVAVAWLRGAGTAVAPVDDASAETIGIVGRAESVRSGARPLRRAYLQFAAASIAILIFAPLLALSADGLAEQTGAGETFIGVLLLAGATSLPELVASLTAVRIGAHELAVGNLFGSNAYNMVALLAADAAFLPGPILGAVSESQIVAGLGAILLMGLALAAVIGGDRRPPGRFHPAAVLVLIVWVGLLTIIASAGPTG